MLEKLGAEVVEVRKPADLEGVQGLVLPGGESSVMDKLCRLFNLDEPLRQLIHSGIPVLGTCAGMILLASELDDAIEGQQTLGGIDMTVQRNAFGSQRESFDASIEVSGIEGGPVDVSFIRAPIVSRVGPDVQVLSTLPDGRIVAVQQANAIALAFHPEVTGDARLHEKFLRIVSEHAKSEGSSRLH